LHKRQDCPCITERQLTSQKVPWSMNLVGFSYLSLQTIAWILFQGATAPSGPGPPHYRGFTFTLRHTTLSKTPLDEWSARRRDLYLTKYHAHKRQTTTPPEEFEPAIPASERLQIHALDAPYTFSYTISGL